MFLQHRQECVHFLLREHVLPDGHFQVVDAVEVRAAGAEEVVEMSEIAELRRAILLSVGRREALQAVHAIGKRF